MLHDTKLNEIFHTNQAHVDFLCKGKQIQYHIKEDTIHWLNSSAKNEKPVTKF